MLYSAGWSTRWRPLIVGGAGLIAASAAGPWIVGLHAPTLSDIRPTLTSPTLIPTSDGRIPMGAYLGFAVELASDHFLVDHNQKIWLAARSTQYRTCDDGTVPLLGTGMVNYLELAVRVAGQSPRILAGPDQSPAASSMPTPARFCAPMAAPALAMPRTSSNAPSPPHPPRPNWASRCCASMRREPHPNGIRAGSASRRFRRPGIRGLFLQPRSCGRRLRHGTGPSLQSRRLRRRSLMPGGIER